MNVANEIAQLKKDPVASDRPIDDKESLKTNNGKRKGFNRSDFLKREAHINKLLNQFSSKQISLKQMLTAFSFIVEFPAVIPLEDNDYQPVCEPSSDVCQIKELGDLELVLSNSSNDFGKDKVMHEVLSKKKEIFQIYFPNYPNYLSIKSFKNKIRICYFYLLSKFV